jgi:hypothetical protein
MSLSLPHRKFVTKLLAGYSAKAAYLHAFPDANENTARSNGSRLRKKPHIQAELTALRQKAESQPDSDFLSYKEIRNYYARVVRAKAATLPDDSDLWNARKSAKSGLYLRFPDKLRALYLDSKLAGYDRPKASSTLASDSLAPLLARIRASGGPLCNEKSAITSREERDRLPEAARRVSAEARINQQSEASPRVSLTPSAKRPFLTAPPQLTLFSAAISETAPLP